MSVLFLDITSIKIINKNRITCGTVIAISGAMLMVADSIGFAGTQSISAILSSIAGTYVSHGSNNFRMRTPMGINNTSPEQFVEDMCALRHEHSRSIAIHTNYNPTLFKKLCDAKGIEYKTIVRNPHRQVRSCYSWAVKKFHEKDIGLIERVYHLAEKLQHVITPSIPNALYLFALNHVMTFNLTSSLAGSKLVYMEQLLESESYFRSTFNLPDNVVLDHFNGHEVRIRAHSKEAQQFDLPDPDIDRIHEVVSFHTPSGPFNFDAYIHKLGYQKADIFMYVPSASQLQSRPLQVAS